MYGSWNRQPPSGYEIVRIHFEIRRVFPCRAGLVQAADGFRLTHEDQNGVIDRVSDLQKSAANSRRR